MCLELWKVAQCRQKLVDFEFESKMVGFQYLGMQLHARLDWSYSEDTMCRKGQSTLYFLRWLGSFNICYKLLQMFWYLPV